MSKSATQGGHNNHLSRTKKVAVAVQYFFYSENNAYVYFMRGGCIFFGHIIKVKKMSIF